MTVSEVLWRAVERVRQGWCQGAPFVRHNYSHRIIGWCMEGALCHSDDGEWQGDSAAIDRSSDLLCWLRDDDLESTCWNDSPFRTQQEVVDLLTHAACLADAIEMGER